MSATDLTLRVGHVIGNCRDAVFHDRIHALEHKQAIEVVTLPANDLARRRLLAKTDSGREVAIALPRDQRLFDGAILLLDETQALIVRAEDESWVRFTPRSLPDAIELGYHAGNLHWRVRFDGNALLVPLEGRLEDYKARLGDMVSSGRVAVEVRHHVAHSPHDHSHSGHHHHSHHGEDR